MADGLNRVMLLGNLGADPELRYTQGGSAVLNMRIATTETYLDKDRVRRERTDWHNVVVWGKRGEALRKILTKGSSVFIEGSLRTSSYDDRDGNKRYKTEIHANNLLITGSRGRGGPEVDEVSSEAVPAAGFAAGVPRGDGGGSYGSTPASGGPHRPRSAPATAPHAETPVPPAAGEGDDFDSRGRLEDDLPF
jgi:single-strand DNA-binding protein